MTTIQKLQRLNEDLRTRLSNLKIQKEIVEASLQEKDSVHLKELREKDKVIKMLQEHIATLEDMVDKYKEEQAANGKHIKELNEKIEELRDQRDKLKAMLNKDSTNSSKPPSSNGFKTAKAKSTREKSGKKTGGQPGHHGHTINPFPNPNQIIEKKPQETCSCGGMVHCDDDYASKQVVDIRVSVNVVEERVYNGCCVQCGKKHSGTFSEGLVNPVQYGPNVKALIAYLNGYGNLPLNKTVDIINGISAGALNLSEGTIVNFQRSLAEKIQQPLETIKQQLILCNVLGADETGCRVNGKLNWFQIFSNSQYTLFGLNKKRGDLYANDMDLLELFTGILVHDHFKSYYGYKQMTHAECNAHILRYLNAVIEIMKHPWATEMAGLLRDANKLKKECLAMGKSSLDESELAEIFARYDRILEAGEAQYKAAIEGKKNISNYNDERLLLKRLKEYKEEHLRFLADFAVPFDNNGSEQCARFLKNKIKVIGCFRSEEGAKNYAKIASLISTLKKQGANLYLAIFDIFNGVLPTLDPENPPIKD
jgi:transposase